MTRRKLPHGPDCQACADPARLATWLAGQRARADALFVEAAEFRAAGETLKRRLIAASAAAIMDGPQRDTPARSQERDALQQEAIRLCGLANAAAQTALIICGDADRVEAAHPAPAADAAQGALFLTGGAS
ncbi:hypothetical protein ACFYY8_31325 [Streptosporangium sp. NPDC001559]|uniref:hypothetical protein n=1 Tax=Streptosporangium sp. NPDC001559 TaxID=3366187 RepID=UPI0036EA1EB6